jgi:uncharacterized protein YndB with AHSA1/START domain
MTNGDTRHLDGELEQLGSRWQLRFVRKLAHSQQHVWRAMTEAEHLQEWFPFAIEGELRTGAPLRFVARDMEDVVLDGEMVEYRAPSVMELRWDANETVRFEIEPDGDGCVLTLLNTFEELGKASRDAAGWHACLDALGRDLDGETAAPAGRENWEQLFAGYTERFGPAASTLGPPEEHPYSD